MSDGNDPVLDIRELTVRFGSRTVVDRVALEVRRGEVVALVGESGSGKSLTARAVLGLLPDSAGATGSVLLDGTEIVGSSEDALRGVRGTRAAMVFQEPQTALNPVQKIGTQIAQALRAHGPISRADARARAVELLGLVDIPEPERRVDWYPHQLSGGQKQRVVIALALSGEPDLLIADEPTTALDVTVQAEILDLLRDLQRRKGTAVLFITHNLGVVAEIADRVVVLRGGRVVEQRPVRELFATPRESYTRTLLAAVPRLPDGAGPAEPEVTVPEASEPVVRLRDLTVVYGGRGKRFRALRDVSLAVAPREVIGLVGESGSGKSTLGRAALGLVPAHSGEVVLQGVSLRGLSGRELRGLRKNVALVHQDVAASLDPRRTIEDSIGEPLRVHRVASGSLVRAKVAQLLESVRLPGDYAGRRPGELSGGQRQRVALARALALAPRLLVADEPTSALDVSVQAQVLDLFADLRAEYGFACLFISHDLAVVHQVADRVVVLRAGSVVETGTPAAVFGDPREDYTRRLLAAVPIPDPARHDRPALPLGA
ncbi:peptide/nickel transport system ATP-binding protein [Nocardia transvalensis]|uniref:Peptide/nickel transport system ATP-binding protein n=1 Tax=Nocardia transvalensis TaxID=37333 RepID=A0A7W9UGK9_9NOCA|nr:ABC transporter ATP-binding protein [Nocardia transvalensis]MBB5912257.1 peptide/nickel transport system ATP-binding protein [Nocardia transvalensis]